MIMMVVKASAQSRTSQSKTFITEMVQYKEGKDQVKHDFDIDDTDYHHDIIMIMKIMIIMIKNNKMVQYKEGKDQVNHAIDIDDTDYHHDNIMIMKIMIIMIKKNQ